MQGKSAYTTAELQFVVLALLDWAEAVKRPLLPAERAAFGWVLKAVEKRKKIDLSTEELARLVAALRPDPDRVRAPAKDVSGAKVERFRNGTDKKITGTRYKPHRLSEAEARERMLLCVELGRQLSRVFAELAEGRGHLALGYSSAKELEMEALGPVVKARRRKRAPVAEAVALFA